MRYSGVSRPSFEEPLIVSGQLKMTNVQEPNNSRRRSLTPMAFGRFGWTPLPCVYPPLRSFFGRFWGTSPRDFRRRICYALGYFDLMAQIKKRGRPRICTAEYWREYYTRNVFICGLHQSGTSVPGRNVARPENCTGFKDPGVIEDEGSIQH
jgi:hypothetical protein